MSKNIIPEIAKMLGVEINESFKLAEYDNVTFRFTENRFWQENGNLCEERSDILAMLLAGNEKIVKLPWKPKKGELVYTFCYCIGSNDRWTVTWRHWENRVEEIALLKAGWVYRTRAEAEAALPEVVSETGIEYEIERNS